jgi:hypothetical protein
VIVPGYTWWAGGRAVPLFRVCGLAGLVAAVALSQALTAATGRSAPGMAALSLLAVLTFLGLAMAVKILVGEERLVYLHHEIAVLVVSSLALLAAGAPVLAHLDLLVLGIGAFLVLGRVGCLFASCCHGRPHRWGVRYTGAHGASGLDPHLIGARLFPTQLVEAAGVLAVVVAGSWAVLGGAPAGTALTTYLIGYDVLRFGLEFVRGDARPQHAGFSQAQWLTLTITVLVAAAELAGLLPVTRWHLAAAVGLLLWTAAVAVLRGRSTRARAAHRMGAAAHARELAAVLDELAETPPTRDVRIVETTAGLRISRGRLPYGLHYTLSTEDLLGRAAARRVARLVIDLHHPDAGWSLTRGGVGTFHVLVDADRC